MIRKTCLIWEIQSEIILVISCNIDKDVNHLFVPVMKLEFYRLLVSIVVISHPAREGTVRLISSSLVTFTRL